MYRTCRIEVWYTVEVACVCLGSVSRVMVGKYAADVYFMLGGKCRTALAVLRLVRVPRTKHDKSRTFMTRKSRTFMTNLLKEALFFNNVMNICLES